MPLLVVAAVAYVAGRLNNGGIGATGIGIIAATGIAALYVFGKARRA